MSGLEAYESRVGQGAEDGPSPLWAAWAAAVAAALGFVVLIVVAGPDVIGIAALVLLATTGLFFAFGSLAGYVQLDTGSARSKLEALVADQTVATEIAAEDGEILFANAAAMVLRQNHESIERAVAALPGMADAAYRLARAAEHLKTHEEMVRRPGLGDEPAQWLRVRVEPVKVPALMSDKRRYARWVVDDVSRFHAAETALKQQIAARDAFVDALPVGLARLSPDGILTLPNGRLRDMLRTDGGRPLGLGDVLANGQADLILADWTAGRLRGPLSLDLVREDGTTCPARVLIGPTADCDGRVSFVALEDARSSDVASSSVGDGFERLLNGAPFGIATIDSHGKVIHANAAFQRMCPESDDKPSIVRRLTASAPADQRKPVEAALLRALSGRVSASAVDVVAGDALTARSIVINPLTSGGNAREAAVIFVADATEQKALELKFAQSQRMEAVGKLAGGIAHDFNNVLTVIIGLSDLLLQARRPTDSGYGDLIQIRDNARRAANMVKQLLAFSRKQTLEPQIIGVNELLQDFAMTFKKTIGEQIDVKHVPTRDLWPVKADRTQLDQVLLNLAVNAKDAMPNGGRLRLRAKNVSERESLKFGGLGMIAGEYVLIEVEDNGSGMSREVMSKIFEPFFTTKDVGKGTGLGLSTVYGIVKQTGGFIYPVSELGRGTTFRVFLPRHVPTLAEEAEALAAVDAKKKEQPRDLTGTGRVLLVEDEDGVRSFAVRALQRQGYDVIEAISGAEALEVLEQAEGKVDLVVSDVIMPEMDGPTMYNEMIKSYPGLKIIFMSGYPSDAFERSLDAGAEFHFLQKPVNLAQLAAKVKEVITAP